MHRQKLAFISCSVIAILMMTATGYSSENEERKPELSPTDSKIEETPKQVERIQLRREKFFERYFRLKFPVNDEFSQLNARQNMDFITLHQVINLYAQVYGTIPDSIKTLVESDFLLYWPRDLLTGGPSKHVSARELVTNEIDFSSFRYQPLDDSQYIVKFVTLDYEKYEITKEKIWIENSMDYYGSHIGQVYRKFITGGTKKMFEIEDFNTKLIVAKCQNFNRIICGDGLRYSNLTGKLPCSFEETLFNNTLFIREGLSDFSDTIQSPGVNYKWGYDYDKKAVYITLDIEGERYIEFTSTYVERDPRSGGTGFICGGPKYNMEELDMSTPLVSSADVSGLTISDKYLITLNDIPLN